jgi:hypothetical protein
VKASNEPAERREGLSAEAFHRQYLEANRPVILTDQVGRWPALARWTDAYLIERFGDRPVNADVHEDGIHSAHHLRRQRTTLGALLGARRAEGARWSLVVHVLTLAPYLIPDYSIPTVVAPEEVESSGFWIKPQGATSGLHFDHQDGLLGVIRGRKRVLLFSPDQVGRLYPCPIREVGENVKRNWSEIVDIFRPEHPGFDRLDDAVCDEVILEAGEMLFIPKFWWHAVDNQTDLTLSINFFLTVDFERRHPSWPVFYDDRVLIERLLVANRG